MHASELPTETTGTPDDLYAPDPYPEQAIGAPSSNGVRPLTDSDLQALIQTLDKLYEVEGEFRDHFLAKQSLPRVELDNGDEKLDVDDCPDLQESWRDLEWTIQEYLGGNPTTDHHLTFDGVETPRFGGENANRNVRINVEFTHHGHISILAGYRFFSNSDVWFELHSGTPTQWGDTPATERLEPFLEQVTATLVETHDYGQVAVNAYLESFCPHIAELVTSHHPKDGTASFSGLNALNALVTDGAHNDESDLQQRSDTFPGDSE